MSKRKWFASKQAAIKELEWRQKIEFDNVSRVFHRRGSKKWAVCSELEWLNTSRT